MRTGTHHVVRDELEMPRVDVDLVHVEHARDLAQDRLPRRLDAVRAQDRVDVVRVDRVLLDEPRGEPRREAPQPAEVRAVRRELQRRSVLNDGLDMERRTSLTPLPSSLPAKQSLIPGISRTTVFTHARSTIPTSSSFGPSASI
jgi:hypothetical protein